MVIKTIDGIKVTVKSNDSEGVISDKEIQAYVDSAKEEISQIKEAVALTEVNIAIANGKASVDYKYSTVKFERIRRITGYLVGTIDRWNNAKKAEERDRVKHDSFRGAIKEVAEKTA